jgi:heptosyltransferase-2
MPSYVVIKRLVSKILQRYLSAETFPTKSFKDLLNVLIIRQHNQFGDLLASVSLFRAIKEKYPGCHITLIASPENYYAVTRNEFIDELFIFNKHKILQLGYFSELKKVLKKKYDMTIVPATVSVSLTSCILAALSNSKVKIGPNSLDGNKNIYAYMFNNGINLDWRKYPDAHVSDFILEIIRPFGITTKNFNSSITFNDIDTKYVHEFLASLSPPKPELTIGFHIGAGKLLNKWPIPKFIQLIERIRSGYSLKFYFTGSNADKEDLNIIKNRFGNESGYFMDRSIPEVAALVSISDLFITNDTGVMHVAGAVETSQISLFGPTNPFNWAPVGSTKYFLRKSDFIDDISVEDVFSLFNYIIEKHIKPNE